VRLVSCLYDNHHPWHIFFPEAECVTASEPEDLQEKDILILHGGGDISPSLYGHQRHPRGGGSPVPDTRDRKEWAMLQRAIELKLLIIGICRGGQMLCAAAGGFLVQDVNGHVGTHEISTHDGKTILVNSIHHQMMVPWDTEHKLLGWSSIPRSKVYHGMDRQGQPIQVEMPVEPELIYFPAIRGIAIQWHPEMLASNTPSSHYIIKEIKSNG